MKKIAIIGQGYVGKAFKDFLRQHYDLTTYDPAHNAEYPEAAIRECELAVICVPTPIGLDGSCDTSIVERALKRLDNPRILIKSTVPPTTTERLRVQTGKKICFSPEYIGESTYFNPIHQSIAETPFVIVGGPDDEVGYYFDIFEPVMGPHATYYSCSASEAELIKYMANSYLAAKVTFANEFYEITKTFGLNWHRVREGWLLDERVGRAFSSVFANKRGFGGKCLPKDVSGIVSAAVGRGYFADFLSEVLKSNERFTTMNEPSSKTMSLS
ncbi:MAG TPA: hypothetical protein VLI05_04630 [Candidatus Saccharimonadia bacterium]|nr:hypothetical protein [Candidatus Saccharimonadia bacterium]